MSWMSLFYLKKPKIYEASDTVWCDKQSQIASMGSALSPKADIFAKTRNDSNMKTSFHLSDSE